MGTETDRMAELSRFEADLEKLRVTYEMYFRGIEKKPPTQDREAIERWMRLIMRNPAQNTAYKFRRQSLGQKLISLKQYWDKTMLAIEEGRYLPHKKMADRREREREKSQMLDDLQKKQREILAAGGSAVEARKEARKAAAAAGFSLDDLHRDYLGARQKTGESTNISKEKLAAVLEQQRAALREKLKCKDVQFKVSIENGKTKLKAVPIR